MRHKIKIWFSTRIWKENICFEKYEMKQTIQIVCVCVHIYMYVYIFLTALKKDRKAQKETSSCISMDGNSFLWNATWWHY